MFTDQLDYAPGSTAILTGEGFQAGETVQLRVVHLDNLYANQYPPWQVTDGDSTAAYTDEHGILHLPDLDGVVDGKFQTTWDVRYIPNSTLQATATGLSSGEVATTIFTDSENVLTSYETVNSLLELEIKRSGDWAQTFSVAGTGTYTVDKIVLSLRKDATAPPNKALTVSIRASYDGPVLWSATINTDTIPTSDTVYTWMEFTDTLGGPETLNYGTTYFIQVTTDNSSGKVYWQADDNGTYANGTLYNTSGVSEPTKDALFKVIDAVADVTITVAPAAVAEDGPTNLVYTFTRASALSGALTVAFTIGGTATASDYSVSGATFDSGTNTWNVTIANGATTADVTINPTADSVVELDETVTLTIAAGTGYNIASPSDATGTITNDDTAGITVSAISGNTTEAGGTATFTVQLTSQPVGTVVLTVSSSKPGEGTPGVATLTFDSTNWNTAQTVTVTGQDDFIDDGDQLYTISVAVDTTNTTDAVYKGGSVASKTVGTSNTDNDTAGMTVTPTSGLTTTEGGGTATFTVKLNSQPLDDVTVTLGSSRPAEGTVPATPLTFTSANWNVAQTVTITGVDDFVDDGDQAYTITVTPTSAGDPLYNALPAQTVGVTNNDNDVAGIQVSAISGNTTEAGSTATFTVKLTSQPVGTVVLTVSSSKPGEGTPSVASLTFDNTNWNTAQTVTVTGQDDFIDDGDQLYTITVAVDTTNSTDAVYKSGSVSSQTVSVTNTDNDTAGIQVSAISNNTTEAGGTATFTVKLNSQPVGTVVLTVSSSKPGEGTPGVATLTFDSTNWNTAQTVTVTGQDDFIDDGDQNYTISVAVDTAASTDAVYKGGSVSSQSVGVTNIDNDTAGIQVSAISGNTTEAGGTATFTVQLTSQPVGTVVLTVSSSKPGEGAPDVATLTFDDSNWNQAQTVTITGQDDFIVDGDQNYTITVAVDTSNTTGAVYKGGTVAAQDVAVTNRDDDAPGILVSAVSNDTTEAGGTATFTVQLTSQPVGIVVLTVSSSKPGEGTAGTATLIFDGTNWNTAQTVTITGQDDFIDDGDQTYTITIAVDTTNTTDGVYNSVSSESASAVNEDDDTAGIQLSTTTLRIDTPAGTAFFLVVLTSQPTSTVTVTFGSTDPAQGTLATATFVFTPDDWNAAQIVTVVQGPNATGNTTIYSIVAIAVASDDGLYNGMPVPDVTVTDTTPSQVGIALVSTLPRDDDRQAGLELLSEPEPPNGTPAASAVAAARDVRTGSDPIAEGDLTGLTTGRSTGVAELLPPPAVVQPAIAPPQLPREGPIINPPPRIESVPSNPVLDNPVLVGALDKLKEDVSSSPSLQAQIAGTVTIGVAVSVGYVLLTGRAAIWLLLALTAKPLWKQFDPLEVLYAWEKEKERRKDQGAADDESLQSLVEKH